jgi:GLPGLI family protein
MRLLLFFVFTTSFLHAQQSVRITYESKTIYPDSYLRTFSESQKAAFDEAQKRPFYATLTNNGEESLYMSVNRKKDEVLQGKDTGNEYDIDKGIILKTPKYWRLKNYKEKNIIYLSIIDEKEYYYKKQIVEPQLYFTDKTLNVDKYLCNNAYRVNLKNNDTIKYWYTKEIPIDDGPNTFVGLPGMVLKIESKNSLEYATKIEFFKEKIVIDRPKESYNLTPLEEINKLVLEAEKPKSYIDSDGKKHTSGTPQKL